MEAFVQSVEHPGNHAIIFRRTYPELEKSLVLQSLRMFPKEFCKYNDLKHRWTINAGLVPSYLEFGFCTVESDVFNYQSAEYGFLGIDEAGHFTHFIFQYLMSRLRSTIPGVKPKARLCSNPGGIGHYWLKEYFGIGTQHPDTVWSPPPSESEPNPPSRCFIPAKVTDNPFLMENDPNYVNRLKALPPVQRKMLLDGDWTTFSGKYFTEFNKEIHVIPKFDIPKHWNVYRCVDYGYSAPFSCLWVAVDTDDRYYVFKELYQSGLRDKEQAQTIVRHSEGMHVEYTVCDPTMRNKKGDSGRSAIENYNEGGVTLTEGSNSRVPGWMSVRNLLAKKADGKPGLVIMENCHNLIRELEEAISDDNNPEDVDTRGSDHAIDALRYFAMSRPRASDAPAAPEKYKGLDEASKREWKHFDNMAKKSSAKEESGPMAGELNREGDSTHGESGYFMDNF